MRSQLPLADEEFENPSIEISVVGDLVYFDLKAKGEVVQVFTMGIAAARDFMFDLGSKVGNAEAFQALTGAKP